MCGIFGIIHFNNKPVDTHKAEEAAKVLSRRGPDDYGTLSSYSGSAFFCHYRLSIIELSKLGHQPMTSGDGRYAILYNGEIYNYKELSNLFPFNKGGDKEGVLKTNSDTEVLLKLFTDYGEESLKKLRGMFAFAVWDEKEKSLFAARDRFGIKPFYYLINNDEFIFSSELKAIKHYKNDLTFSQKAVDLFLKTGSVSSPHTIYNEVKSLHPGECIKINHNGKISLKKWWQFEDVLDSSSRIYNYDNDAREEIKSALIDSVKAHCVSDVEVGAFLSGGIDSTSVVSLMKKAGQQNIRTISVSFPGSNLDESSFAKIAAQKYGVDHKEYPLSEDEVINDLDKFFCAADQLTIDGLNTYFVSKAAASLGLKVVMSGLGGDELFGGYATFRYIPMLELINKIPFSGSAMKMLTPFLKFRIPPKAIDYLKNSEEDKASYKLFRGLFTNEELKSMGRDNNVDGQEDEESIYNSTFITKHSALKYVSYLETTNYMANQLLRDSDIFSMHHSIELRVPFVDDRLYSVVLKYIDKGYNKNYPKQMLVDAAGDLPGEIINRKKMGFTFPFDEWIRNGKLGSIVKDNILSGNDSIDKKGAENFIRKFDAGKLHWSRLWALFVLSRFSSQLP